MRVIFMGTPAFAVQTLQKCIESHEVVAVFTQPDRPKGRGNKLTPSEVKIVAEKHNLLILQPEKIRKDDWAQRIRALEPDVIVVVAFGQLLSQEILDIPKYGCINVHASLLPKYRGAAPINWAIAKGETQSGVTTMMMDAGLDTGDMLLKSVIDIDRDMTAEVLHDHLATMGADLLIETLSRLEKGDLKPEKQVNQESCYAPMMNKDTAKINWALSAVDIHNHVRAFNPWPVAHTQLNEIILKVYKTETVEGTLEDFGQGENQLEGTIIKTDKNGIYVKTGHGVICIKELQFGSGKRMSTQAFLLGNTVALGTVLV